MRPYLFPFLQPHNKILIVGCGNSNFSADLYDAGYPHITNIDFSAVVIEKMKQKHTRDRPLMTWIVGDICNMRDQFPSNGCFDFIFDKSTMDALSSDEGDVWYPGVDCLAAVDAFLLEVSRLLQLPSLTSPAIAAAENGDKLFLQVSFAQPHFRTKYLMGRRLQTAATVDSHQCEPDACVGGGGDSGSDSDSDSDECPFAAIRRGSFSDDEDVNIPATTASASAAAGATINSQNSSNDSDSDSGNCQPATQPAADSNSDSVYLPVSGWSGRYGWQLSYSMVSSPDIGVGDDDSGGGGVISTFVYRMAIAHGRVDANHNDNNNGSSSSGIDANLVPDANGTTV